MASRYSAQLVWIQLRNPESCPNHLFAVCNRFWCNFFCSIYDSGSFNLKPNGTLLYQEVCWHSFLIFPKCISIFFCQKKVYTACFSCAPSPQWLGTNTGSSQGSKGPSYDGNGFFFHNSTKRTCTHKRCRCGNGMVCQSVPWMGSLFPPSSSLFFCNQVLKHFPGSLALHVRYASVYCVYKACKKERKGGMRYRHRWERHLLSVWQWKNFDCKNVFPPQTSTQPW